MMQLITYHRFKIPVIFKNDISNLCKTVSSQPFFLLEPLFQDRKAKFYLDNVYNILMIIHSDNYEQKKIL